MIEVRMRRALLAFVASMSCAPALAFDGGGINNTPYFQPFQAEYQHNYAPRRIVPRRQEFYSGMTFNSAPARLLQVAERFIGSRNPTGTHRAWCADFLNMALRHSGHQGTGSGLAVSFARYGRPTAPHVGAIAVMRHHVGIIVGFDRKGPVLLSGNHKHRVGVGSYSAGRIIAYREPVQS